MAGLCRLFLLLAACGCLFFVIHGSQDDVLEEKILPIQATYMESSPGITTGALVGCARFHISGISRLRNFHKFAHIVRVHVITSSLAKLTSPKTQICIHGNRTLDLCQCPRESWKPLDKGKWQAIKSPFATKYLDARTVGSITDVPVAVSLKEEFCFFRVLFFIMGVALLVLAPVVSSWVPFYYSSAMTMGIILVVLILLFQAMKLLPTGRKSSLYILLYGSLVGVGTVILRYISSLLTPVLTELGLGEDMLKPMASFCLLGIVIGGAWLGYWGVRKFILTSEGDVDSGTARFVKWAIRVVGAVMLLQSSIDVVYSVLALFVGIFISSIPRDLFESFESPFELSWPWGNSGFDAWSYRKKHVKLWKQKQASTSPYAASTSYHTPVTISGKRVFVSPPARFKMTPDQTFYSTFHKTPDRKKMSKAEYEALTSVCTRNSMQELVSSPQFADWALENADRISVMPLEAREERPEDEIELTAYMH